MAKVSGPKLEATSENPDRFVCAFVLQHHPEAAMQINTRCCVHHSDALMCRHTVRTHCHRDCALSGPEYFNGMYLPDELYLYVRTQWHLMLFFFFFKARTTNVLK